jgi:hypothetical protein
MSAAFVERDLTAVPQRGAGWTFFATHTCFDRHDAAFSVSNLLEQNDLPRRTAQIVRMQSCDLQLAADQGQIDRGSTPCKRRGRNSGRNVARRVFTQQGARPRPPPPLRTRSQQTFGLKLRLKDRRGIREAPRNRTF